MNDAFVKALVPAGAAALASLLFALSAGPAIADAPPPLPSLRHLGFNYTYDIRSTSESPDERSDNPSNGDAGTVRMSSGETHAGAVRTGRIEVDVVAATGDGGLVADIREGETGRLSDAVRCTISGDSTVIYDPKSTVNPEAQAVLRYLARGFFAPPELKVGATWPIVHKGTGFDETATYRISALPGDDRATISFDTIRSVRGSRFIEANEHGTISYQTKLLVVRSFQTKVRTIETIGTHRRSSDEEYAFDLTSDSFAK